LSKKVDFMLICGDFFHKRAINAQVLQQAVELLAPLAKAGIPVFAIEGNHDKAFFQDKDSWLGFLNNQGYLHLLAPQFEEGRLVVKPWDKGAKRGSRIDLPGVSIIGLGYLGVTTAGRVPEAAAYLEEKDSQAENPQVILMLHAAVNRLLGQDLGGIKPAALEPLRSKVDYLALGHIHNRYEQDGWMYNPGSLECVHLDEYGPQTEKGFYHVRLRGGEREVSYIASRYRPVTALTVSLTGSLGPQEAQERVYDELRKSNPPPGAQIRVGLTGEVPYSPLSIETDILTRSIKETYASLYVDIVNQINLPLEQSSLTGAVVKREDIERLAFGQILGSLKQWEPQDLEAAVAAVRSVREMALSGEEDAAIVEYLRKFTEESAPGNDPAEEGVSA